MSSTLNQGAWADMASAIHKLLPKGYMFDPPSLDLPAGLQSHPQVQSLLPTLAAFRQLRLVEASLYRYINTFSLISHLPTEVMHMIFRQALEVDSFDDVRWSGRHRYHAHLQTLRLVSKHWDGLLTSSHLYWTCIHIRKKDYCAAPYIARSGILPLYVSHDSRNIDLSGSHGLFEVGDRVAALIYRKRSRSAEEEWEPPTPATYLHAGTLNNLKTLAVCASRMTHSVMERLPDFVLLECLHIIREGFSLDTDPLFWPLESFPSLKYLILEGLSGMEVAGVLHKLDAPNCTRIDICNTETDPDDFDSADLGDWAAHVKHVVQEKKASIELTVKEHSLRCLLRWPDGRLDYHLNLPRDGNDCDAIDALVRVLRKDGTGCKLTICLNSFKSVIPDLSFAFGRLIPRGTRELHIRGAESFRTSALLDSLTTPALLGGRWVGPAIKQLVFSGVGFECGDHLLEVLTTRTEELNANGKDKILNSISAVLFKTAVPPAGGEEMLQKLRDLGIQAKWTKTG